MDSVSTCIANIGPREQRKRMRFGLVLFVVSAAVAAVLMASGVPRWWRLALFLPVWAAATGFFQAREKT
jgi:hypothetical protein